MSDDRTTLVDQLRELLTRRRYNPVVVHSYCRNAQDFISYLTEQQIALEAVTPADVAAYLRLAVQRFRKRHGHAPARTWVSIPRAGIHALLTLALNRWPPDAVPSDPGGGLCREVCQEYQTWLREERGLATASIEALMGEARPFCAWYLQHTGRPGFMDLSIQDVDTYVAWRAPGLRRKSLKDMAERLRSLMRHLHRTGRTTADLAPRVIAPRLYAYEGIPSVLSPDEIATVVNHAREDRSPIGLRDHAILRLLATYGVRAGEIKHLRLDDIDWHGETLRIRHSKTGAQTLLPLTRAVGEALIDYLRQGRPTTEAREVFIRSRAPYRPLSAIYSGVRRRMEAAGVTPNGKRGPHIFRHARAVSLLRASVPRKVIGDLLGHRSTEATIPYLKLATEDLRAIALEVPGTVKHVQEERS